MTDFVKFLLEKVYKSTPIPSHYIDRALLLTLEDVKYHFAEDTEAAIVERIENNSSELAVFLFRLGNSLHLAGEKHMLPQIHWVLKDVCSCELYFNNIIEKGFYIIHGEGTVIGSRNRIGMGFKVHQGCTVGHKKNGGGAGNVIGNDVTMYAHSTIAGELTIGDNVIIGAHAFITEDVGSNQLVISKPSQITKNLL